MICRPNSSTVSSKTSLDEEDDEFDNILTFIFDLFVELILFLSQMEESTTTPPVRKYNLYYLFYYMKLSGRNFAILRFLVLVFSLRILSISPFWPAVLTVTVGKYTADYNGQRAIIRKIKNSKVREPNCRQPSAS